MVQELRRGNGRHGLVLANGGVLSYQHVICLSSQPRTDGSPYPPKNPLPNLLETKAPPLNDQANSEGTIEVSSITIPEYAE